MPNFKKGVTKCTILTSSSPANAVVTCKIKKKPFPKISAAVDDRRKIILMQHVENVPKTFFREVGVATCQSYIAVFKSASSWRHSSIKMLRILLPSVGNITNLLVFKPILWLMRVSAVFVLYLL